MSGGVGCGDVLPCRYPGKHENKPIIISNVCIRDMSRAVLGATLLTLANIVFFALVQTTQQHASAQQEPLCVTS